jgi:cytochrome c peroxidase
MVTLRSLPEYVELFKKSFPQEKEPLSFDNMARAIEVFEATLITANAPFDLYLKGDTVALTGLEKEGLELFLDKGCVGCHNGINIGGMGYFPFGVMEKPESEILPIDDTGRFKVTNVVADEYVFRSPSLRNVALTPPYFHSGKVWKLLDSVRVMGSAQLGISLSESEAVQITAFLKTLTGEQPRVEHPILPPQMDDTPRPVLTIGTGS